ncbi:MAG: hypothetical protein FWC65_01805 [Treponema sp.]|nr:hypothetical protein [Treponema sp.]
MNRICLGILFLFFINLFLHSQDNNNVEVRWYTIIYDKDGNISEFVEADEIIYDTPIMMRILLNGFRENASVRSIIIDDEGNISFEQVARIRNNEVQFQLRLLTTEKYLISAARPYIRFRYEIHIRNQYHFYGEYFNVAFAVRMYALLRPDILEDDRFVLRSTDGYYEHEVHMGKDGVFSGYPTNFMLPKVFTFPNVIPGRYYSLHWINRVGREFPRMDITPFHEILNTIEREANMKERESLSPFVQISILLACLLLLLISFVCIVEAYKKKKSLNISN